MNHNEMRKLASERCPACKQSKLACKGTPACHRAASIMKRKRADWGGTFHPHMISEYLIPSIAKEVQQYAGFGGTVNDSELLDIAGTYMMTKASDDIDPNNIADGEKAFALLDSIMPRIINELKNNFGIIVEGY